MFIPSDKRVADPKHLFFVRHGESEHHVNGLTGGWTNTPLTDRGRLQVAATAAYLKQRSLPSVRILASDLERASQSAEIIGATLGIRPQYEEALRELNNGDGAGLTLEEAAKIRYPEPAASDVDWRPFDNAETWREMATRINNMLAAMNVDNHQTVLVVGHGGSGQELVKAWLGLAVDSGISFHFDAGSVTELRLNRWGEREIAQLNRIPDVKIT